MWQHLERACLSESALPAYRLNVATAYVARLVAIDYG